MIVINGISKVMDFFSNENLHILNRFGALLLIASLAILFKTLSSPQVADYSRRMWRTLASAAVVMCLAVVIDWRIHNTWTECLVTYLASLLLFGFAGYLLYLSWHITYRVEPLTRETGKDAINQLFARAHKVLEEAKDSVARK